MSPIVYIGNISLGLAFASSLLGIIFFVSSRKVDSESFRSTVISWGRGSLYANFLFMTAAILAMFYALLSNDFGVSYVAEVGSRESPRWVSAVSLWSSLDGSILLWVWLLASFSALSLYVYCDRSEKLFASAGLVLLATQIFFYILLALPANPFLPVSPVPMNGPGPNPLLQNHWLMIVHPPCLYFGYIGFTIPFAFAIAALFEKEIPLYWSSLVRRWTLFSWSLLSIAIVLGAWWSYAVLGWGGYWAWDPVENASLMPWLSGTALIHCMLVQQKRKLFVGWNIFLTILTFLLTLLGTFLTRSGVLDSVHSFTESDIGPYFLVFIGIIFAASLALLIWNSPKAEQNKIESLFSLEVLFLFNNLILLCLCLVVFIGTLYPIAAEMLTGTRISVGEPYFNQMTIPLGALLIAMMGLGFIFRWNKTPTSNVIKLTLPPLILSILFTVLFYTLGITNTWVFVYVLVIGFSFLVLAQEWLEELIKKGSIVPRRYVGMLAHTGFFILVLGIVFSSAYEVKSDITLRQGETIQVHDYTLTFERMIARQKPHRFETKAVIHVNNDDQINTNMSPQMNFYPMSKQPIASPAIRSTLLSDLYLTLNNFEKDGSEVSLKVITSPGVSWIWIGGLIILLSGLLAMMKRKKENV